MSIKFTGSAAQNIDLQGRAFAVGVEVDKPSNGVTLISDFGAASLVLTDGNWTTGANNVDIDGDTTFNITDTVLMGSALWTIAGNFDPVFTGITFDAEGSTIKLTGSGKTWNGGYTTCWYERVWIAAGANITLTGHVLVNTTTGDADDDLMIDGTLNCGAYIAVAYYGSGISVSATGVVNSTTGYCGCKRNTNGIKQMDGVWNANLELNQPRNLTVAPATYGDGSASKRFYVLLNEAHTDAVIFPAGTTTINMNLEVLNSAAFTGTIDMLTNNASLDIKGDFSATNTGGGSLVWSKGSGSITFSGSAAQTCLCEPAIEDIIFDKPTGTVTLTNDLVTDSLTGTEGSFDAGAYNVTTVGSAIFDFATLDMGSATWTVGTSFDCADCNSVVRGTATLKLIGTGTFFTGSMYVYSLWITSTATITIPSNYARAGDVSGSPTCQIDGTLICTGYLRTYGSCQVTVSATANISGAQGLWVDYAQNGGGIVSYSASATVTCSYLSYYYPVTTGVLVPADYSSVNVFQVRNENASASAMQYSSGTYTFYNWYHYETSSGSLTIDNSVNNPDFHCIRYMHLSGGIVWTKGSGTITFDGNADHGYLSTGTHQIENTVIAKTGGKVMYIYNDSTIGGTLNIDGCQLNMDAYNDTLTVYGDFTFDNSSASLVMGDATAYLTLYGNYDNRAGAAITRNTGIVVLKGAGKTFWGENGSARYFYSITVDTGASYTVPSGGAYYMRVYDGDLKVYGTLTANAYVYTYGDGDTYIYSTGVLNGSADLYLWEPTNGHGLQLLDGTLSCQDLHLHFRPGTTTAILAAGDYSNIAIIHMRNTYAGAEVATWTPQAGTYIINKLQIITYGTAVDSGLYIECDTNNPNFQFYGDLTFVDVSSGSSLWDSGTGTITFLGSANSIFDMAGTYEHTICNKTGGAGLTMNITNSDACGDLSLVAGDLTITGGSLWLVNMILAGNGAVSMTNSALYPDGDWDDTAHTGTQTITPAIYSRGTHNWAARDAGSNIRALVIDNTFSPFTSRYNVTSGKINISELLRIMDTCRLEVYSNKSIEMASVAKLDLNAGGSLTGSGAINFNSPSGGGGIEDIAGTASISYMSIGNPTSTAVFAPGVYQCGLGVTIYVSSGSAIFEFQSGEYTFEYLLFRAHVTSTDLTIDCSTNNGIAINVSDWAMAITGGVTNGDVTIDCSGRDVRWNVGDDVLDVRSGAGDYTWLRGTGEIVLSTAATSGTIDFCDMELDTLSQGTWPCYYFDGENTRFYMTNATPFAGGSANSEWALGGWIWPEHGNDDYSVIFATAIGSGNWSSPSSLHLVLYKDSGGNTGKLRFNMEDASGHSSDFFSNETLIADCKRWRHVWLRRYNNNVELYIDGVLDNTVACGAVLEVDPNDNATFGKYADYASAYYEFRGYMREWGKWDSAVLPGPAAQGVSLKHYNKSSMRWMVPFDGDTEWFENRTTTNDGCVLVEDANDIVLSGGVQPANFYGWHGDLDMGGQTIDSPGNVSLVNTNAQATDQMDGCTINCDTFYQGGSSPDMHCGAQSTWYLNAFTSADFYTAGIGYCDASRYKDITPVNNGITALDARTGTGYIMYSEESLFTRFNFTPGYNSAHTVAVVYTGGNWYFDNNTALIEFTARPTDILIADVDFTNDTITDLVGVAPTVVNGIVRGYDNGDLVMIADRFNEVSNDGEFVVYGTYFKAWGATPTARPICDDRTGNIGVNFDKSQVIMLNYGAASYDAGIYACNRDGSEYRLLNYTQEDSVEQLSTQQSGEMIYWTSSVTHGWMSRMSRDGLFYERIKTGLGLPLAMTVCAEHGYVWWSEYDGATIERCDLDGSNQVSMGFASLCSGLAVDPVAQKLYVSEKGVDIIYSMDFDGTNKVAVHTLAADNNPRRLTIDYVGGWLYWSEDDTGGPRIRRGTTAGGSLGVVWSTGAYALGLEYNHNDEYLYFCNAEGYTWKIKPQTGTDLQIVVDKSDSSENYWCVGTWDGDPVGGPPGSCPDDTDGKIYVFDVGTSSSIRQNNLSFTSDKELVKGRLTVCHDSRCDDVNGKLYWVDYVTSCIKRCNLNGSRPEMVVDFRTAGDALYYMAIDPIEGYLFFSGSSEVLYRSNLDGTDQRVIRAGGAADSNYSSMGCERQSKRLYFTSSSTGKILYCNYDGTGVTTLVTITLPGRMCIDQVNRRVIFWANGGYHVVDYTGGATRQFGTGGTHRNIVYSPDNDFVYMAISGSVYGKFIGETTGGGITAIWSPAGGNIDGVTICHKHQPSRGDGTSKLIAFADGLHNMHHMDTKGENLRILTGQIELGILNSGAYANTSKLLFWADYYTGKVYQCDSEFLTTPILLATATGGARALCISQTREEVYFYDHGYGIWSVPFGGGTPVNILTSGQTSTYCRGMWCQENEGTKGKIYWSGSDDIIRKADCDGGNAGVWLSGTGTVGDFPLCMTGDNNGRIFWGAYSDADIYSANEDGSDITVLRNMTPTADSPGTMVYNPRDDHLYWGNYNYTSSTGSLFRMRSDGTGFETIYKASGAAYMRSLAIIHGLDIPMKDPVFWLKMDDDYSTGLVTDYSANAEHQTFLDDTEAKTEAHSVTGTHGAKALDFDVSNHSAIYLTDASHGPYLDENTDFTISWWWKSNDPSAGTANHFMSNYAGNNSSFYCMLYSNNVYLYCQKSTNGGTSVTSTFDYSEGIDDQWHHYAMTRRGLTLTWYIDGVAVSTQTHADNYVDFVPTGTPLRISLSSGSQASDGECQDYRIYDRGLTAEQIVAVMNYPKVPVR